MTAKWIKPIINMVLPTILFYVLYKTVGIIPAIIVSAVYSAGVIAIDLIRGKRVKNSQITGLVGLLGSAAAIALTGNEKYYYLPALIENAVFFIFMLVLTIRKKSVLHFLGKDFELRSLEEIPENKMFSVNILWMAFFALKIISKAAGILFLDFNKLYWLVFILGDPMTILVVVLSIILIRRRFTVSETTAPENEAAPEASK